MQIRAFWEAVRTKLVNFDILETALVLGITRGPVLSISSALPRLA